MHLFIRDFQLNEPGENYNSKNQRDWEEWARFVSENYQHILGDMLRSIRDMAKVGVSWVCGDTIMRIFFPGILIESLDYEEAVHFLCCRAASANYPCPRCLVHKSRQHELSRSFTARTSSTMKAVLRQAHSQPTAKAKEDILRNHGLHDTEVDLLLYTPSLLLIQLQNFAWDFLYTDPYRSYRYDVLHVDDLGKFGHHILEIVLEVLGAEGLLNKLVNWYESVSVFSHYFSPVLPASRTSHDGAILSIFQPSNLCRLMMASHIVIYPRSSNTILRHESILLTQFPVHALLCSPLPQSWTSAYSMPVFI
jgi:hypothetical protein